MQPVLNIEDIKRVEVALTREGVSISELMHRAGCAAAQEVARLGGRNVVVFCGMGNNGGDGWVAAEALLAHGIAVKVVSLAEPDDIPGDLAHQVAQKAERAGVPILAGPSREEIEAALAEADTVLDCMLGTGFHGEVRTPIDIWIDCVNASGLRVVACDVPSGLSAQTGLASGPVVYADMTVTMLALKPGLLADDGRDTAGTIVVAPLAEQTAKLVVEADPVAWRPDLGDYLGVLGDHSASVDKFTRGSVLVVGGSGRFIGAPIMAARAAARMGAGYVTLAVPEKIVPIVQSHVLEIPVVGLPCDSDGVLASAAAEKVVALAKHNTATLIGPGLRCAAGPMASVQALLRTDVPLVIDADGLNCLARLTDNDLTSYPELTRRDGALVLTPHRRELGRLVGRPDDAPRSLDDQLECARQVIWSDGGSELCVVAKGTATGCVSVDQAILPKPGPAALATAGSGDVLAGMIASSLAQAGGRIEDLPLLCSLVCEVHGFAASLAAEALGSRGVMASDVIDRIGLAADAIEERVAFPEGAPAADGVEEG